MEPKKHRIFEMFFLVFLIGYIPTVKAGCIDVLRPNELPSQVTTAAGIKVDYSYNLEKEEYFVSWVKDTARAGPFGPFILQRSCHPAAIVNESNEFLILEANCGTFCWYYDIFSLATAVNSRIVPYQKVWRPLAFDSERNLLANYDSQDLILIKNLITEYEQKVPTAYKCDTGSGLCFRDVTFKNNSLEYIWRSAGLNGGELIRWPLDDRVTHE